MGRQESDSSTNTSLLFTVFLGSMLLGGILMCFLSTREEKWEGQPAHSSVKSFLKSVIAPLLERRVLLIIPLLAYSGLQQAFVWAEFTKRIVKPALGVSGVGGAMAVYGAGDAICSILAGRLTSSLASVTLIVCGGAFLQSIVLFWLLFGYSLTSGLLGSVYPLLMAAMLGVGNGVFNTQLNALVGMLFKRETEAAFAQLKLWQSGAIAVIFFLSPYISLQAMLLTMVAALCIALSGFLYLTLHVERSFLSAS
ncbi:UNC93-like protein 3 [Iris pallida]|uniref:UNC93-like protein 3 n=1 Tax=Iris pallida TaxID=29817 RepID=A0AAX6FME9_IRIPA|nr:UNC93-like protein 3 [Iris pallida]